MSFEAIVDDTRQTTGHLDYWERADLMPFLCVMLSSMITIAHLEPKTDVMLIQEHFFFISSRVNWRMSGSSCLDVGKWRTQVIP